MFSFLSAKSLFLLKTLSFSITSVLAVIGLLNDFKDKTTGKLTRWGRVNLCGIVASFLIGVVSQKIDDDRSTASAKESSAQMASLVEKNSELLASNNKLLTTTAASLQAGKEADSDLKLTLKNIDRTMQLVGTTINVNYRIRVALASVKDGAEFEKNVESLKMQRLSANVGSWTGDDTQISSGPQGVVVFFGGSSPLITSGMEYVIRQPPFTVAFTKEDPATSRTAQLAGQFPGMNSASTDSSVTYEFASRTTSEAAPVAAPGTFRDTPMADYIEHSSYVEQVAWGPAAFELATDPGQFLSGPDFGGKYLRVRRLQGTDYQFCSLNVRIGPYTIDVPMSMVKQDANGFSYRLPATMKQSSAERALAQKDAQRLCPNTIV